MLEVEETALALWKNSRTAICILSEGPVQRSGVPLQRKELCVPITGDGCHPLRHSVFFLTLQTVPFSPPPQTAKQLLRQITFPQLPWLPPPLSGRAFPGPSTTSHVIRCLVLEGPLPGPLLDLLLSRPSLRDTVLHSVLTEPSHHGTPQPCLLPLHVPLGNSVKWPLMSCVSFSGQPV